eukprot:15172216-Alexandrium_andersonii.AAC.1
MPPWPLGDTTSGESCPCARAAALFYTALASRATRAGQCAKAATTTANNSALMLLGKGPNNGV